MILAAGRVVEHRRIATGELRWPSHYEI